jgi:hypothetical protein
VFSELVLQKCNLCLPGELSDGDILTAKRRVIAHSKQDRIRERAYQNWETKLALKPPGARVGSSPLQSETLQPFLGKLSK